jgi:two-component system, OmpR family, response regulator
MRLLLVEDDQMIGESVRAGLQQDGFAVDWVQDGRAAELALETNSYDTLLLDLGLPRKAGIDVLASLRRRGDTIPVLILTARDAISDRVKGLDAGADDYLVKPFDLEELAARVRALLRRKSGRADPVVQVGGLMINPATHEVTLDGKSISLSAREFALIHTLAGRPGVVYSRTQLEEKLYGWGHEVESNTVEVYIHSLRRKLSAELIQNVRGVGYMVPKQP